MKKLFAGVLAVLCVATAGTVLTEPSAVEEVPVLYWVTDNNPARTLQLERFHAWLEKDPTRPKMIMKVDYADIDGASGFQRFWRMTRNGLARQAWPQLVPVTFLW